jgi:hypothetical protein
MKLTLYQTRHAKLIDIDDNAPTGRGMTLPPTRRKDSVTELRASGMSAPARTSAGSRITA